MCLVFLSLAPRFPYTVSSLHLIPLAPYPPGMVSPSHGISLAPHLPHPSPLLHLVSPSLSSPCVSPLLISPCLSCVSVVARGGLTTTISSSLSCSRPLPPHHHHRCPLCPLDLSERRHQQTMRGAYGTTPCSSIGLHTCFPPLTC